MKIVPIVAALALILSGNAAAQQLDVSSNAAFIKSLEGSIFESSFRSYPKVRFIPGHVEVLGDKDAVKGPYKTEELEPGIIKMNFKSGAAFWWVFGPEGRSFAVGNMNRAYEFTISEKLTALPDPKAGPKLTFSLTSHPEWQKLILNGEGLKAENTFGDLSPEFPVVRYNDFFYGVLHNPMKDDKTGVSALVLSRDGTHGWWLEGMHIGSGVKRFRNREYKPGISSKLGGGFATRSAQFNYYLLKAGFPEQALANEKYSEFHFNNHFGENHENAIHGLKEMAEARRNAFGYNEVPALMEKARSKAVQHLEKEKHFEYEVKLGRSYSEKGDFQKAMDTFRAINPKPNFQEKFERNEYTYLKGMCESSFGLGKFDASLGGLKQMEKAALAKEYNGYAMSSKLYSIACYLAKRDQRGANAALDDAIAFQKQREKASPQSNFVTSELSMACTTLKRWPEALSFSEHKNTTSGYYTYEELARVLCYWNKGEDAKAKSFAKHILDRFDGSMDSCRRSNDDHEMYMALIEVLGDMSPASVKKFHQRWDQEKKNLRRNPMTFYLFGYSMAQAASKIR